MLTVFYIVLGMRSTASRWSCSPRRSCCRWSQKAGFDLIWFGIFIVLLVEIAQITPPVGFNLFVLQTMTGRDTNYVALASLPFFF